MAHWLIVDDEQSICWGLAKLAAELGHTAATAASAEQGLDAAHEQRPDVIVLDVRLPGMDGLAAMQHFRQAAGPGVPILVMTAYGELATAVQAVRNGAFDYLTKPFDLAVAERAILRALEHAARTPESPARLPAPAAEVRIVGSSPAMQEVFKRIALVAPSEACVHLRGESGTGKELAARAVHRYSRRAAGAFVAVNMASLSPTLAESELFGHTRGAFTGAEQARKGLLEQADGGTIFLDEVAEIPLALQVKLLRVLEHGEILPVGADRPVRSDFRLVSATHQDLGRRVVEGVFRHDLYFRLITFEIEIPPLRRRREDIPLLVEHFLAALTAKTAGPPPAVSPEAMVELGRREWYGNVRELRNAIEHAMILARGGIIAPEHLPPPLLPLGTAGTSGGAAGALREDALAALVRGWAEAQLAGSEDSRNLYEQFLSLVEPPLLQAVLEHCGGQCLAAARRLGLHRTTLRKKLDQRGLGTVGSGQ
ncbi:MAG: sigma-54 dependent transcriptional regulator [Thermoguttaceae bacterium]|jgi:two-component system nitrogen regulation response regulator GlnG